MAVGLSSANFADAVLDALSASTATLISSHVEMHTGDPGSAGTANIATVITGRQALTWGTKTGTDPRSRPIAATFPSWTGSGTTQTISHLSVHNAVSAGTFRFSAALTTSKSVAASDTFTLNSLSMSYTPIAA